MSKHIPCALQPGSVLSTDLYHMASSSVSRKRDSLLTLCCISKDLRAASLALILCTEKEPKFGSAEIPVMIALSVEPNLGSKSRFGSLGKKRGAWQFNMFPTLRPQVMPDSLSHARGIFTSSARHAYHTPTKTLSCYYFSVSKLMTWELW